MTIFINYNLWLICFFIFIDKRKIIAFIHSIRLITLSINPGILIAFILPNNYKVFVIIKRSNGIFLCSGFKIIIEDRR